LSDGDGSHVRSGSSTCTVEPSLVKLCEDSLCTSDLVCTLFVAPREEAARVAEEAKNRITMRVDGRRMEVASRIRTRADNTGITSTSEGLGAV